MDWAITAKALIGLGTLGLLIGIILAIASVKLTVKIDPREEKVRKALPGANCGACGYPGCDAFAAAVTKGTAPVNGCKFGGATVARKVAGIMGQEVTETEPMVAVLSCRGDKEQANDSFHYIGTSDCREAVLLLGGPKACTYGCIGLGNCERVCPVGAIKMSEKHLPVINEDKCVGCGACIKECPKNVLLLIPKSKLVYLACSSHDPGRAVKQVCKVGCIACGLCVKNCPVQALKMENDLPVMDFGKCTDCGICVHKCPTKSFIDRARGRPKAVINPKCTGCGLCIKECKFHAIEGEPGKQHKVIADKCIGCGLCYKVCPEKAIDMVGALGHARKTA
ncbi:hypothetical protein CH330_03265 [candidate division WOR-3 bacterium JGI_Cruoil_03_51_56]|uniref:Ion-translocating oxidoreductase complex subunit B n=1 Tax=candidate division WOR-3 bacterium JGI_Cruoil_03_51_56 TaxID=1973747 RepID=A0A235BV86_UNCW3|nr:MAG: hypothetical protein CH330_03265 [candidate division WOR-3 bacterium JGI_Cruoil_03_51_56]